MKKSYLAGLITGAVAGVAGCIIGGMVAVNLNPVVKETIKVASKVTLLDR